MKKIISTIFILSFIMCFSTQTYALSSYKPKYGTLDSNVNFRTTASTSLGKIRVLSARNKC